MKIAVVGAGSSGLITLKYLLEQYPAEDVVCFEKGQSVRGCWGDPRPDFVSTSTKYTTQFSCFRKWRLEVAPTPDFSEFFRGAEFGDYLDEFADQFALRHSIRFGVELRRVAWEENKRQWVLTLLEDGQARQQSFEAVFLCTGVVNQKIPSNASAVPAATDPEAVRNATVVVVGGGESAADIANHLAKAAYNNTVYLSLRSGIRVSPRYHPIRGVPSDFLRNRLLLSFDKGVRNWIGERFVTFRIRFNRLLTQWFPHQQTSTDPDEQAQARRREWDLKLKARAKGGLFNVFHNKSDDFLDAVGEQRLEIIGPPVDDQGVDYFDFEQTTTRHIAPDLLVWSTGYRSGLSDLSDGLLHLQDFYHGCVHAHLPNLFLIGFARPIIGNIPAISEMQARYAVGVLTSAVTLPNDLPTKQTETWQGLAAEYPAIDTANVYPVEQYPYSDLLARELGLMPTRTTVNSYRTWLKIMLTPASNSHYIDDYFDPHAIDQQKIYTPPVLIAILVFLRMGGYPLRLMKRFL